LESFRKIFGVCIFFYKGDEKNMGPSNYQLIKAKKVSHIISFLMTDISFLETLKVIIKEYFEENYFSESEFIVNFDGLDDKQRSFKIAEFERLIHHQLVCLKNVEFFGQAHQRDHAELLKNCYINLD
jgi:hypothetical protein